MHMQVWVQHPSWHSLTWRVTLLVNTSRHSVRLSFTACFPLPVCCHILYFSLTVPDSERRHKPLTPVLMERSSNWRSCSAWVFPKGSGEALEWWTPCRWGGSILTALQATLWSTGCPFYMNNHQEQVTLESSELPVSYLDNNYSFSWLSAGWERAEFLC